MKTIIYLSLAALLCTACGCTKDNLPIDKLPPITQTGANTFGCLYNGKVFTPVKPDPQFMQPSPGDPISVYGFYFDTDNFSTMIYAVRSKNITNIQFIHVYIYQLDFKGIGSYN